MDIDVVESLLKGCRIENDSGRWLYWDDTEKWVIRNQPYRARKSRVVSTHGGLKDALLALTAAAEKGV